MLFGQREIESMTRFKSQMLLLLLTVATTVTFFSTTHLPDQNAIMSGCAVLLVFFSLALERRVPHQASWNQSQGDTSGDITMAVSVNVVLESVLIWITPFILLWLIGGYSTGWIALSLPVEVLCVGLLIEFGAYVSHRLHHQTPHLWALHAMHHSPQRLYTLNNFRFHPLNYIINHSLMIVPAMMLGFSAQAILGYNAIALPILLLQHSNIDFRFGRLNAILNTNEVHRWHHSAASQHSNVNLGRATVLFDRLFGTYWQPTPTTEPESVGLNAADKTYPAVRSLRAQMCHPFFHNCCRGTAS